MALLQISEPGQSAAPHQHRLAVGIDLGTTNSLVATVRSGAAAVLPDEQGRALLPSIKKRSPGTWLVPRAIRDFGLAIVAHASTKARAEAEKALGSRPGEQPDEFDQVWADTMLARLREGLSDPDKTRARFDDVVRELAFHWMGENLGARSEDDIPIDIARAAFVTDTIPPHKQPAKNKTPSTEPMNRIAVSPRYYCCTSLSKTLRWNSSAATLSACLSLASSSSQPS